MMKLDIDLYDLKDFSKLFSSDEMKEIAEEILHEANGLAVQAIYENTPEVSGNLRAGWSPTDDAFGWGSKLPVNRSGNRLTTNIYNPVWYASFVEYGHKQEPGRYVPAIEKQLVKDFVPGKYYANQAVNLLERDINQGHRLEEIAYHHLERYL